MKVSRSILVFQLQILEFHAIFLKLIKLYLSLSKYVVFVIVDHTCSHPFTASLGVRQYIVECWVLCSLSFLLKISLSDSPLLNFFYMQTKYFDAIKLQSDLNNAAVRCCKSRLHLNVNKYCHVSFSKSRS